MFVFPHPPTLFIQESKDVQLRNCIFQPVFFFFKHCNPFVQLQDQFLAVATGVILFKIILNPLHHLQGQSSSFQSLFVSFILIVVVFPTLPPSFLQKLEMLESYVHYLNVWHRRLEAWKETMLSRYSGALSHHSSFSFSYLVNSIQAFGVDHIPFVLFNAFLYRKFLPKPLLIIYLFLIIFRVQKILEMIKRSAEDLSSS